MDSDILKFIEEKHDFFKNNLTQSYEKYKSVIDIGLPLILTTKLFNDKKEQMLTKKYMISTSEFDVLMTLLCHNAPMKPTLLYENIIFSSGGMSKLLKKLETKELIERTPSLEDKRSTLVSLSAQGKDLTISAFKDVVEMSEGFYVDLSDEERRALELTLKKILKRLSV